jgi:hypothetical protein
MPVAGRFLVMRARRAPKSLRDRAIEQIGETFRLGELRGVTGRDG